MPRPALVLSCEHASRAVPRELRPHFRGADAALESHRGWDPGALEVARHLADRFSTPLFSGEVSRLVCDLNRSEGNAGLFSEWTRELEADHREAILDRWYRPHRAAVAAAVAAHLEAGRRVLHVGIHSFTPVFAGVERAIDLSLLYDPRRPAERALAGTWIAELRRESPALRLRRNAPYRGKDDGLTTAFRRRFGPRYLGLEVEMNQALVARPGRGRREMTALLETTLARFV